MEGGKQSLQKFYFFPARNLMISIPIVLILAFITGKFVDTSWMGRTILIATMLMIYPTMIGFQWRALINLTEKKLIGYAMLLNFIFIPLLAYVLGLLFLREEPILFAGLALVALLPTSGMTISWTSISKGNVPASVKLTVLGLLLGAILAPFYLYGMVGQFVNIKLLTVMRTILVVVFIPLLLGLLTTRLLRRRFPIETINGKIKPKVQPISIWAMLYIIFASVSMRADVITQNIALIWLSIIVLILFYLILFALITWLAKRSFSREDGLSLVYGTTLRNLSIAIGVGAASFGMEATLLITIAFMVQQQGVVMYNRLIVPNVFKERENITLTEEEIAIHS